MEEFINNFNEFKEWLYNRVDNSESYENEAFVEVLDKFEELELNKAF